MYVPTTGVAIWQVKTSELLAVDGVVVEVQLVAAPPLTFQVNVPANTGLLAPPFNVAVNVSGVPRPAVPTGESVRTSVGVSAARFTGRAAEVAVR